MLTKQIAKDNGQNNGLKPPTIPIGENRIYINIIAENRLIETGKIYFQGLRLIVSRLGYIQALGLGIRYPITSIIMTSIINKIA